MDLSVSEARPPSAEAREVPDLHARIQAMLAKELFFIGAYPKSGTTWLQLMLNAHPEIGCSGEGHFIDHFARHLETAMNTHNKFINRKNLTIFREFQPFPCFDSSDYRYLLRSAIALALLRAGDKQDVRMIGEKTPDNVVHFHRLEALFPAAKFLHMVRDGRDCAVSAWFHNQRINPEEQQRRFPTMNHFVQHVAANWKACVEHGLQFGEARHGRCMVVRYEDLCHHPRETLRAMLLFLGADAGAGVVRRCIAAAAFEKLTGGRVPGAEDRSSFLRRGTPGNWQEHLSADNNSSFVAVAGAAMARLGYQN